MAFKLKGKEEKFFSILENHAELTYESAEMMERVFKGEVSKEEAFLEIDTKEKAADELVNETVDRLRKTFITPMDREDIQLLIDQLDTTLDNIKEIVNTNPTFKENLDSKREPTYNTNNTAIETIASWANIAKTGGFALSGIFLVISILVIFNTIRMAIYSRSEEIYMEKLVGADNHFVRGPFLVEAMISGILAGIFATILGFLTFGFAAPKLASYDIDISEISKIIYSPSYFLVALTLILLGIIIAFTSSRLAVSKYLKRV